MIGNISNLDVKKAAASAADAAPLVLHALGRLYGLGPSERRALGGDGDGVPTWAWVSLALVAGAVIGSRVQKAYPTYVPKVVSG